MGPRPEEDEGKSGQTQPDGAGKGPVAQVERESIRLRQAEGIAAAKARGVRFGRPKKRRPGAYKSTRKAYLDGHITRSEASSRLKVSISTFDKWLREDRVKEQGRL